MLRISGCACRRNQWQLVNKMPSMLLVLRALCFIIGLHQVRAGCENVTSFTMRVDTLLAEYDRSSPPAAPVKVSASLIVRHANIYEDTATVRLLASLHLNWEDSRLEWNASDWGCDKALVMSERLWLPDVVLLTAATSSTDPSDASLKARISSNGQVSWVTRLDVHAPVSMDLYSWPADEHDVVVKFGSRGHPVDEMDLVLKEEKRALMFESSSWEAVSVNCSEGQEPWESEGVFRGVVWYGVRLRRTGRAHGLALGAVLTTTTMLLLAAAMLSPDSRPALAAAAAFTSALWLISSAPKLAVSARVPLALSLVCVQCICACVCAAAAALVRRVSCCAAPPPPLLRALLTATSQLCRLTPTESGEGQSTAWAAAARLLDRSLLLLILLTVLIVHCIHLFQ